MKYQTKIYPTDSPNSSTEYSSSKNNIGVCFSGGGSRAMTCAWGQMLGLNTVGLLEKARYISSVSGGTWAASIYSYLPEHISDSELLGTYFPPNKLTMSDIEGCFNINTLGERSLGNAPAGMHLSTLVMLAIRFLITNKPSNHKWLWAYIVGKLVLDPFDLRARGDSKWSSTKFFSLSKQYAQENFPADAPAIEDFHFLRSGRPFPIINNNIILRVDVEENSDPNILLVPNQVTPIAGGVRGKSPDGQIVGGGLVESYGVSSTLDFKSTCAPIADFEIEASQPYSLIDIVSTSSAYFAEFIASHIDEHLSHPEKKKTMIERIEERLTDDHKKSLFEEIGDDVADVFEGIGRALENFVFGFGSIVPSYNYWPVREHSENRELEYTDGGSLENTGIIGMLAQTEEGEGKSDAIKIVAFVNTSTPLEKKDGVIIAGSQAGALFGLSADEGTGKSQAFSDTEKQLNHQDFQAESLIQVFRNEKNDAGKTPFECLVEGLYASSCGASSDIPLDESKLLNQPAFCQLELTTVSNELVGISGGRKVTLLYVQNSRMLDWQAGLVDETLKAEILKAQDESFDFDFDIDEDFKGFPYYSTGIKTGLEAKESNALSQMWAWAIADDSSTLKNTLLEFFSDSADLG